MSKAELNALYKKIPSSKCADGCFRCCTNMVQFTPCEEKAAGGYVYDGQCSHLVNGKCGIYENRPFVCRIFGTSEILSCEDCTPEKTLSGEETASLVHEYTLIRKREEAEARAEIEEK